MISVMPTRFDGPIDATRLYERWEDRIEGWDDFQRVVDTLTTLYPYRGFVWRGQANASWGLHSSLARAIERVKNEPATEDDLVRAEKKLLRLARIDWRLDGTPALPLFAQMQHVGAPTRLLDVTFNPLIAAWFAVSRDDECDHLDGRLLVFVDDNEPLQLNSLWKTNTPRWHQLKSDSARRVQQWGTGAGRKIWRPPALHARIPAQNAAFLLDGAPVFADTGWNDLTAAQMREFSSIPLRLGRANTDRLARADAPVFTYRITVDGKKEIRSRLEDRFGYHFASVYADIEGLATYAHRWPDKIVGD
ncbi:FRG domain-containing protein [Microbacterium sp. ProA8]|jgi:hypothetical protein|uniref:FRG domain-containing protein n=1 Tax=Microbacterium chionoecetis TaxID=3153754 RepID=UPI003262CF3F